jgi:hypothetical protein
MAAMVHLCFVAPKDESFFGMRQLLGGESCALRSRRRPLLSPRHGMMNLFLSLFRFTASVAALPALQDVFDAKISQFYA